MRERKIERNSNLMMKFFILLSLLALTDAWGLRPILFGPERRGIIAGKTSEQGGQGDSAQVIVSYLQSLDQKIKTVNERVDKLEEEIGAIESALFEEDAGESGPSGYINPEALANLGGPGTINQEPALSDETAVRMLLQQIGSRLVEKKSEQKQVN